MPQNSQILTVAQMVAAEQDLINGGETVSSLMETAGKGAAKWIWRVAAGRSITVLCGPGNNGGDGYVIARVLQEKGLTVRVVAPMEPTTEAAIAARKAWGGNTVSDSRGDVFVDCLFGSGLARPLDDDLEAHLKTLAQQHKYRVAIDLPSGIDGDSGELLNRDLPQYNLTISLGAWKLAHWLMPAMDLMGHKRLVDIGVREVEGAVQLSKRPELSAPPSNAHKYSRGLLGIVAGPMHGAVMLAGQAAQHAGAGYVKVFAHDEAMGSPDDLVVEFGSLFDQVRDVRIKALLVGPGLGRSDEAKARLDWALACDVPIVCDADALHLMAPEMIGARDNPLILTPHAGELEVLGNKFGTVGLDRIEQVTEIAETISAIVVAKGPDTIVAAPGGKVSIMPPASSWLSTAGTGDILAGLIASRLANGVDAFAAAEQGLWLHKEAAYLAGAAFSPVQLLDYIPKAYTAYL